MEQTIKKTNRLHVWLYVALVISGIITVFEPGGILALPAAVFVILIWSASDRGKTGKWIFLLYIGLIALIFVLFLLNSIYDNAVVRSTGPFVLLVLLYWAFIYKTKSREETLKWTIMICLGWTVLSTYLFLVDGVSSINMLGVYDVPGSNEAVNIITIGIFFVYLVCISVRTRRKVRNARAMGKVLLVLLWAFIIMLVIITVIAGILMFNMQMAELDRGALTDIDLVLYSIAYVAGSAVTFVMFMGAMLPQTGVLYIVQKAISPDFYNTFIKENPWKKAALKPEGEGDAI